MKKNVLILSGVTAMAWLLPVRWRGEAQTPDPAAPRAEQTIAFRVIFGRQRLREETYDGAVTVTGGKLIRLEPWRFFGGDKLTGPDSWKLRIKAAPIEGERPVKLADGAALQTYPVPAGLIVAVNGSTASVEFRTARGRFSFPAAQLSYGRVLSFLDGDVTSERVPWPVMQSTGKDEQHDYPSLAVTRSGAVWFAWQAYRDRGEHVYARRSGRPAERLTSEAADVFGTAVGEDARGRVHVVWSERAGEQWHLWERVNSGSGWTPRRKLTSRHSPNMFHKLAGAAGALWLVWVGYEAGQSYLYAARQEGEGWSQPLRVAGPSVWSPAAAVSADGTLYVAWDSYAAGNYDVLFRQVSPASKLSPVEAVAVTPRFEAHASVAVDRTGRPWVAWDESGANWGKDWNREDQNRGTVLYADRSIRVAVRENGKWMQAGDFSAAVPQTLRRYLQLPRLAFDGSGRVWALFQVRTSTESTHEDTWATGGLWDLYLTTFDGTRWRNAAFVPQSTARPEVPFDIAGAPDSVRMTWATDGRTFRGMPGNHELPTVVHYDVYAAQAGTPDAPAAAELTEIAWPVVRPQPIHSDEKSDVERVRKYRTQLGGVEYRIVRGDFHRHTEISYDGAGDGSLEDYFRYMLDGAAMDTGILGDHNMGGDVEYSWWRTEKAYDLFLIPGRFTPLFGYERSVRYPNGHRNVIFDHRGVRTLPIRADENQGAVNSGKILYPYLRQNRGICMEHSMATGQGTDYRDNDPELEPLVEIYQGYHASAEYAGAPRAETDTRQLAVHGPYRPLGFWWNALAKGLRLGVHASSDHISTHCSYAMVFTPGTSRKEIVDNMRKRHAYAATDNIVVDFQAEGAGGERHLMGDDFPFDGRPVLYARIIGTARIAAVHLIRNNEFIYSERPQQRDFQFRYVDQAPKPGDNWYYIRIIQEDGNLAWSSPVWVRRRPSLEN